jgi:20S proteasome alpha/beta subunit
MTVCVGAICDGGTAAVVAADKMVTFGPPMMLQTEPAALTKITSITKECVILFSGSVPDGEEVVIRSKPKLAGTTKPPIAQVGEAVKLAYAELKRVRVEETLLKPLLGVDFTGFQALVSQSSSSQILQQLVGMIMQHNLQLDVLVAGIDDSGSHLFVVTHPGILLPIDTTGFAAIGSGGLHAAVRMSLGKHTRMAPLVEAAHSVYEAKKAAEVAPGVGNLTDMAIIKGGMVFLAKEALFQSLESVHKEKPALSTEDREKLQAACDECTS